MRQILDIDDVISVLDAITVDELRDVAGKILTDSGLNLAITGPVSEEKNLRQLLKLQS
jgi:hypothetical protein